MNVKSMRTYVRMGIAPIHLAASCAHVMMASVWMRVMPYVLVCYFYETKLNLSLKLYTDKYVLKS
jgi:hypothetical protein